MIEQPVALTQRAQTALDRAGGRLFQLEAGPAPGQTAVGLPVATLGDVDERERLAGQRGARRAKQARVAVAKAAVRRRQRPGGRRLRRDGRLLLGALLHQESTNENLEQKHNLTDRERERGRAT